MESAEDRHVSDNEAIVAGYHVVDAIPPDTTFAYGMLWHGWALREAFHRGIEFQKQREIKAMANARPDNP